LLAVLYLLRKILKISSPPPIFPIVFFLSPFLTTFDQKTQIENIKLKVQHPLNNIKLSETGVYVKSSTLGSLEALLKFLETSRIPVSGVNIGPVHKKDVLKAAGMKNSGKPEYVHRTR
jgi:translation initiation factor IF-2